MYSNVKTDDIRSLIRFLKMYVKKVKTNNFDVVLKTKCLPFWLQIPFCPLRTNEPQSPRIRVGLTVTRSTNKPHPRWDTRHPISGRRDRRRVIYSHRGESTLLVFTVVCNGLQGVPLLSGNPLFRRGLQKCGTSPKISLPLVHPKPERKVWNGIGSCLHWRH